MPYVTHAYFNTTLKLPVVCNFVSEVPLVHISVKNVVADVCSCALHKLHMDVPLGNIKVVL